MTDLQPDEKLCPYCAETIKAAAIRCRYCQSDLAPTGHDPARAVPVPRAAAVPVPAAQESPAQERPDEGSLDGRTPREQSFLSSFRLLLGLVALCILLAALTAYAWYHTTAPGDDSAPTGVITSAEARDAGLQVATTLTQKVLTYDWKTLDADVKAAEKVMAPSFRAEYAANMDKVRDKAVKNQVKVAASVVASSIVSATDDKVVALVFVNQITTAKGDTDRRLSQSRTLVTLTRHDGEWRVSAIKPL